MKIFKLIICFTIVFSSYAVADPFSGSANAAQLAELVRQAKEQIEEARKQVSVLENLKEMEQMKEVAYLSGTGESFAKMFQEARSIDRELDEWSDDKFGINSIVNDYERMERRARGAEGMDGIDRGSTYASMLSSINRLQWLGEAQEEREEELSKGASDKDRDKMAQEAIISLNALMLEKEKARQRQEAIDAEVYMDSMDNLNYGNMGLMN